MRPSFLALTASCLALSAVLVGSAGAQSSVDNPGALADLREVQVNIDNFVRAANDLEIGKLLALTGGVNEFFHFRAPTPIDNQPVIRMNRDTLYSAAVVDISEGATLILPDAGDRYLSAMIVNQDHYINDVFLGGGTYELDTKTFDTSYVIVSVRTLVDAAGRPRYLDATDWELRVTRRWSSPESGITYPAGWRVSLVEEGIEFLVEPDLDAQENRSRAGLSYWEGAVTLRDTAGRRIGEGYVELTGYGENNRPPV